MAERTYKTKPLYVVEFCGVGDDLAAFEERVSGLMLKGWLLHGSPAVADGGIYQAMRRPDAEIESRTLRGKG